MQGDQEPESGQPGGGQGRVDEVGGSGVYPASGPMPEGEAEIRTMAEWGQGERGAAGYEDSGSSETMHMPPEGMAGGSEGGAGASGGGSTGGGTAGNAGGSTGGAALSDTPGGGVSLGHVPGGSSDATGKAADDELAGGPGTGGGAGTSSAGVGGM